MRPFKVPAGATGGPPVVPAWATGGRAILETGPLVEPKPRQTAETCAYSGDVAWEVPCRACSNETIMRPVYWCSLYGGAMNRRNEYDMADCSRCAAFVRKD